MPDARREVVLRRRVLMGLLSKEWSEQRWRFALGALVLCGLMGGLMRAGLIPAREVGLLVYWFAGVLLVIFVGMSPVAGERSDRTWEFLVAQPVSRSDILLAKWFLGLIELVGIIVLATLAGHLASWSRGVPHVDLPPSVLPSRPVWSDPGAVSWWIGSLVGSRWMMAGMATVSLASWYTLLFFLLTRARNEFTAALGGVLLAVVLHAWLAQFLTVYSFMYPIAALNPLATLTLYMAPYTFWKWTPCLALVHILLWIVLPVWFVARRTGRTDAL